MLRFEKPLFDTFGLVRIRGGDINADGRFTRGLAIVNDVISYRLQSRDVFPVAREKVVSLQGVRREGSLRSSCNADRYGTEIKIIGDGQPHLYGFVTMLTGALEMASGPNGTAEACGTKGIILRGLAGTRILTTDNSARLVLWIDAARLERTLTAQIGEPPRQSLTFTPGVDWNDRGTRAVWRLMMHLVEELRDLHGLTTNPVALETFTELLLQSILHRLEHNYTERLKHPTSGPISRHLRRAEAFMHASADQPLALAAIAAAAGCSAGTLRSAFRRFRDTTPLAALHDVRLQHAREALLKADADEPTWTIARRFGFTNPSRFISAYGRRFGERPKETRRRGRA